MIILYFLQWCCHKKLRFLPFLPLWTETGELYAGQHHMDWSFRCPETQYPLAQICRFVQGDIFRLRQPEYGGRRQIPGTTHGSKIPEMITALKRKYTTLGTSAMRRIVFGSMLIFVLQSNKSNRWGITNSYMKKHDSAVERSQVQICV